jgi:hypothetical protein
VAVSGHSGVEKNVNSTAGPRTPGGGVGVGGVGGQMGVKMEEELVNSTAMLTCRNLAASSFM